MSPFFSPCTAAAKKTGPPHAANPIVSDRSGARPGGTPFVDGDGLMVLPVQDCSRTYGGGIRFLKFMLLSPEAIVARRIGPALTGEMFSATHPDGCHTLSRCGDLTLVDTKRVAHEWSRHWVNLQRNLSRPPIPVAS